MGGTSCERKAWRGRSVLTTEAAEAVSRAAKGRCSGGQEGADFEGGWSEASAGNGCGRAGKP
jgi:hypothetical protein